jgi:hypothetical protein
LKISWAQNPRKGAISGPGNLSLVFNNHLMLHYDHIILIPKPFTNTSARVYYAGKFPKITIISSILKKFEEKNKKPNN